MGRQWWAGRKERREWHRRCREAGKREGGCGILVATGLGTG